MGHANSKKTKEEEKIIRELKINRSIADGLDDHKEKDTTTTKILLLGPSDSGKSTIFKQFDQIYGAGYSESHRRNLEAVVKNHIVMGMQDLCSQYDVHGNGLLINNDSKEYIENLNSDTSTINHK